MSGRFKRRKRDFGGSKMNSESGIEDAGNSDRHPPHLRGKEIGLFYARRNRERKKLGLDNKKSKPVSKKLNL